MKAKFQPRIDFTHEQNLEDFAPLDTPWMVLVDPSDICNFRCKFCPTGDRCLTAKYRKSQFMSFDLFKKIIGDLCEFGKPIKALRLYKDGEPLANPKFPDMVKYAKDSGCTLSVDTVTNGSLLNPKKNLAIIEAGLDKLVISVNGLCKEDYLEWTKYHIDFDTYVDNIKHLYANKKQCQIYIKMCGDGRSDSDKQLFLDLFGDSCDRIFFEHVAPVWPGFVMPVEANKEIGIYGEPIKEVQVCPYIFYSLTVNSDGTVSLCFTDWSHQLILGDLKTQSFKSIWQGEALRSIWKQHLDMKRKEHPVCGKCSQMSYCSPRNIDAYAEEIKKKL